MLEIVRSTIENLPISDFGQYFAGYCMEIQDTNIDLELSYMLSHNVIDVCMIDRAITDTFERLMI